MIKIKSKSMLNVGDFVEVEIKEGYFIDGVILKILKQGERIRVKSLIELGSLSDDVSVNKILNPNRSKVKPNKSVIEKLVGVSESPVLQINVGDIVKETPTGWTGVVIKIIAQNIVVTGTEQYSRDDHPTRINYVGDDWEVLSQNTQRDT